MNAQDIRNLSEAYMNVYEEVDKRRAPKELVDRLNASREGNMAQDGPNKPAYDAKQRLLKKAQKRKNMEEQVDLYDIILSHLLDEGYAETPEAAEAIMVNMGEEWRQSIVEAPGEWFGGLIDKARESRASQIQSMQPTQKPLPSGTSPFSKPASKNDSGKLTTYGAGGGAAAERAGQTRDQVMRQGAINRERKNKPQVNPGPDFGR